MFPLLGQGCYTDLAMSSSATHRVTPSGVGPGRQTEGDVPEAGVVRERRLTYWLAASRRRGWWRQPA